MPELKMPELRKDPLSDIWVVLAPERKLRPQFRPLPGEDFLSPANCPFCEGNESMTPPEIYATGVSGRGANQPGWHLRAIPNKYPALRVEGHLEKRGEGFYDNITGIGAHEIIIETNSHTRGLAQLDTAAAAAVFRVFKQRILDLKKDMRLRYIQVFKNHGIGAGATISHSHSQLVGMPVVPARLMERLKNAKTHYDMKERCFFCDMISYEIQYRKRVLFETPDYIVMSPYAPRFPFELTVYPRVHGACYEETGDEALAKLAVVLGDTLRLLDKVLDHPAYNLLLHHAPFNGDYSNYFHWHWELIPSTSGGGGFELGTYTYVNPTPPEEAIEVLQKA